MKKVYTIAIVGNPNVGKTALINTLAGSHLKIGNWPGVTVEKKEALLFHEGTSVRLIDLPGVYGLNSATQDEVIINNYLHSNDYDVIINVIDANNMKLNMYLTSQLLELGKPLIVAINFWEEFEKNGNSFDYKEFSKRCGIDAVPIEAIKKEAKQNILYAVTHTIAEGKIPQHLTDSKKNTDRKKTIDLLLEKIYNKSAKSKKSITDVMDRVLLHPFLGIGVFFMLFYFVFKWTYDGSSPFIDWIDGFFNIFVRNSAERIFIFINAPSVFQSFVYDGLIAGIGTVMTFIPLMAFLYFFIALLEESGYIARVAFLLDTYMMAIGLPGKAFIPLIIGFGCNVPGVYATRTLEEESDKKIITIIISFISCGAKLPIYILFSTIFFPRSVGLVAVILYFLGMIMAVVWVVILKRWFYKGNTDTLIIELPEYRLPTATVVWNSVRLKVQSFIRRAGTIITAVVILVWALTNLPYGTSADKSILATMSKNVSPIFTPLGWGTSWRATAAVVPGFLAKEAVVGALMSTYNIEVKKDKKEESTLLTDISFQAISLKDACIQSGKAIVSGIIPGVFDVKIRDTPLTSSLNKDFTPLTAFSFMVFNLLLMSCTAVMGAVRQEFGTKFLLTTLCITGGTAYLVSLFVFQFGRLVGF